MHLGEVVCLGSPGELKAAIGGNDSTLEDVFVHYTGAELESGGSYRETSRTRRTARRLS
jgi:ABC-2 type transport system ATP-binding protein